MSTNVQHLIDVFITAIKTSNLVKPVKGQIFYKKLLIPRVLNLETLDVPENPLYGSEYQLIELNLDGIYNVKWHFLEAPRRSRAIRNLNRKMRGFGLAKDSLIVGDIWFLTPQNSNPISLNMLGITCGALDVYSTDASLVLAYRGRKLSIPLNQAFEIHLKREGWKNNYLGFYADNIAAVKMHRALNFVELPARRVSLSYIISEKAD